jgi:Cu/Ag efflux pump CusA
MEIVDHIGMDMAASSPVLSQMRMIRRQFTVLVTPNHDSDPCAEMASIMNGAVERVRPKMMTVFAIMAGLLQS